MATQHPNSVLRRDHYRIFTPGVIGRMRLSNRLVRSATWDPSILQERRMTDDVVNLYRDLALGGVGLIITGDFSCVPRDMLDWHRSLGTLCAYDDVRIVGFGRLVDAVHRAAPGCKIVAQISGEYPGVGPSDVGSPFTKNSIVPLSTGQVKTVIHCFAQCIAGVERDGFDGVQLHAAHGSLLSRFLSPYTNRRDDQYGGAVKNRARIMAAIVAAARKLVGAYPILVKMNCTDHMEGGIDEADFVELAKELESAGVDAIEISGGMKDCLGRTEAELGFRPVPDPWSRTRITRPEQQSYYLAQAERLDLRIPVILVGGNRDVERLEEIVQRRKVDFIAMCRPLLREPDLPNRWRAGRGSSEAECTSCNSCIYDMRVGVEKGEPALVRCVLKADKREARRAQRWLASWVKRRVDASSGSRQSFSNP
jgi:2,4-dienoyl-CoA reductase-like NADH-dependent reductase (Old Yellow Enzyme family)